MIDGAITESFAMGVDLGPLFSSGVLAPAASEVGARVARVHIGLSGHSEPDDAYIHACRDELAALQGAGLRVVAVVGADVTVAPGGLGSFEDPPAGALYQAWDMEWTANLETLARALGDSVSAWELLPEPNNVSSPVAPRRWLRHVIDGAAAIRAGAPNAVVVPGVVISDGHGEPARFLASAFDTTGVEEWHRGGLSGPGLALRVATRSGTDEDAVINAVRAAVESARAVLGGQSTEAMPLGVVTLSWSVAECTEEEQGRNLWAAFNTVSSLGHRGPVVWNGLMESGGGRGLFRGVAALEADQRPAWAAFNDFALYVSQIAPSAPWPGLADLPAEGDSAAEPLVAATPEPAGGPLVAATPEPAGEVIRLRIPSAEELLRAQGLRGKRLEAAVEALASRHPFALTPGDYELPLPAGVSGGPDYTNQDVISAFYRVGGGTWELLERAGIVLGEIATDRNAAYAGSALDEIISLTDDEKSAILGELERVTAERRV